MLFRSTILAVAAGAIIAGTPASAYEGFGATTPGGANGARVVVTNLNDSGPGSLRDAISQGNRLITFSVGGDIVLQDYLYVGGPFVTIDGFSAPGPGITLRGRGLVIRGNRGAHDVIVRGLRVRGSPIDGIQVSYGAYNVVIDHVSVANSVDGNIDITEDAHDVTVSWSILAGNEKNMLIKYNPSRVSVHHNVFTEGQTRNPQVRIDDLGGVATQITADVRNNVIANAIGYGTLLNVGAWGNVVNNYFIGVHKPIQILSAVGHISGNLSSDGTNLNVLGNRASPFPTAPVATQDACTAARAVLAGAGRRPLDTVDAQYLARIPVPACGGAVSSGLQVTPSSLGFDATAGGVDPPAQQLQITEQGGLSLAWTAAVTSGASWLTVTPGSGTAPSTLTVRTDPGNLGQGTYSGTIVVTAPGATGSPRSIPVTLVVDPASTQERRIVAEVAIGTDDAREYVTGIVRIGDNYLAVGKGNLVAIRFSDVDVPPGAVIRSAVLEFYGTGALDGSVVLRYDAEDVDSSKPFGTTPWSLSSRPRTRAYVDDEPDDWVLGEFNASPDLRAVVQEVVERPNWRSGNSLTIFIDATESTLTRRVGSFETTRSSSRSARLTILYQVP